MIFVPRNDSTSAAIRTGYRMAPILFLFSAELGDAGLRKRSDSGVMQLSNHAISPRPVKCDCAHSSFLYGFIPRASRTAAVVRVACCILARPNHIVVACQSAIRQ